MTQQTEFTREKSLMLNAESRKGFSLAVSSGQARFKA
jgi:hypothetical protein